MILKARIYSSSNRDHITFTRISVAFASSLERILKGCFPFYLHLTEKSLSYTRQTMPFSSQYQVQLIDFSLHGETEPSTVDRRLNSLTMRVPWELIGVRKITMSSKSIVIVYPWASETTELWRGMKIKMKSRRKKVKDEFLSVKECPWITPVNALSD